MPLLLAALIACHAPPGETGDTDTDAVLEMVFRVQVPADTPVEDQVYLQAGWAGAVAATDLGGGTWEVVLDEAAAAPLLDGGAVRYAWTRGQEYVGGEALPGDPDDAAWRVGRSAPWQAGALVEDSVARWRFFPPAGTDPVEVDAGVVSFAPRMGGVPFRRGVQAADYWWDNLVPVVPTTDASAVAMDADWLELSPPWNFTALDPLPVIAHSEDAPEYSEDALREHLRQASADGLSVMLNPQVCCSPVTDPESRDAAWFYAYFDTYREFLLFHAQIADEEGVDAMVLDWSGYFALPGAQGVPADAEGRWRALLADVREVFDGPIGFQHYLAGDAGNWVLWPSDGTAAIADAFDFIGVSAWAPLVADPGADQAALDQGVEDALAMAVDPVQTARGQPVVFTGVAYGSYDGAASNQLDVYEVALAGFGPESDVVLASDQEEQARIFRAFMTAAASRPEITGIFPFHYNYVALPEAPDYSVRGKAAAAVLLQWYADLAGH